MTKKIKVTSVAFDFAKTQKKENNKVYTGGMLNDDALATVGSVREDGLGQKVRVRIIKAPLVNQDDLRNVVFSRARAIVL